MFQHLFLVLLVHPSLLILVLNVSFQLFCLPSLSGASFFTWCLFWHKPQLSAVDLAFSKPIPNCKAARLFCSQLLLCDA
jgi:hypothetical protein